MLVLEGKLTNATYTYNALIYKPERHEGEMTTI